MVLVAFRVWDPPVLQTVRLKTFDLYQVFKPREPAALPVVIIDIDEKSLRRLGQWPWPRTMVAALLENVRDNGGVAMGFDVVFPEIDRLSPDRIARSLEGLSPEAVRELSGLGNTDEAMAAAMRTMRIVLGQAAAVAQPDDGRARQAQTPVALLGRDPKPFLLHYPGVLRNIEVLEKAASGKGLFSINPDADNIVRRVALVAVAGGALQPALSVELLRVATGKDAFAVKTDDAGVRSVIVGGVEVPTDRHGRMWVRYTPHLPARYVSASDVIDGSVDPARIRNHLVLLGTSATGLLDLKATPLEAAMPGVEVHAQILETILGRSYLIRPNYALGAELVIAVVTSLLVIVLAPILGALPVLLLGMGAAAGVVAGSWAMFTEQHVLIDVAYPLMAGFAVYLLLVFVNYRREEVQRQQIRSAFGQYLAPAYVEQIARDPSQLSLGGETRTMTILFSDVRGFTTISESYKSDPQGLTALMNRFLTPLSDAIMARKGTIDKYMGDAVMAFWNAPLDDAQHAKHACQAALDMMARLVAVNVERKAEAEAAGTPFLPLDIGIGINTGTCVVGNMGSEFRFDYSVLGDAVNLASRLEGQSKTYGVPIILGSGTAQQVLDQFAVIEIDLIRVKGKLEPERVFCLAGDGALLLDPEFRSARDAFEAALAAYRAQKWDEAMAALARAARQPGIAPLAELYEARIKAFADNPPPANWDGVFVATSK
ncbi:adenylate/guanylate cyclase domain-containing protein [Breoghania sp. L-A4]|nr:adenylate/guanylate cyclase domain-containing protein [Breoghania sp. L-A4]